MKRQNNRPSLPRASGARTFLSAATPSLQRGQGAQRVPTLSQDGKGLLVGKISPTVHLPIALTIAGSDSGGGAGIQADLKTFAALGVHGTSALTCITAQNPKRVLGIQACTASMVRNQLAAVFEELTPVAAKTGMLFSGTIIRVIADWMQDHRIALVVDPVMISTRGARLLAPAALDVLCRRLLPLATLITPNLSEAEVLTGTRPRSMRDLRAAAKQLHRRFGVAVLVKGGHLKCLRQATDIFYDGTEELLLRAPFVRELRTHGTGCAYSAAITAYLAAGVPLLESVSKAKQFITQAIAHSQPVGRHHALNSFWLQQRRQA